MMDVVKGTSGGPAARRDKYRAIFEHAAVSLWEQDISSLRARLREMRRNGVDLRRHLEAHPAFIQEAIRLIEVTDVNQATLRLFGASRKDQLLGPITTVLGDISRAAMKETILAIDEGRSDVEVESMAPTLDGKTLHLIAKTHIPPEDSQYARMLVSFVDITARKRAEDELAEERGFFRMLMDNLPDQIYFKDASSRFIRVSRSHARALGLDDPSQEVGKRDEDFFSEEHARKALEDERQIARTGVPLVDVEERLRHPDRPDTWVLTTKMPLRGPAGEVRGTFGISHDITERKLLEAKNQQLAALVESADDAIVGMDMERRITVWSRGAERIYGYSAEEMIGARTPILIPPELEEEARIMRERVVRGEQLTHYETVRVRKDGAKIIVSLTLSAIRNAQGLIVGLASVARDVTEQKAIEAQLNRVQRLESLATLAGGVAHRFNNINTVVKGYLGLLRGEAGLSDRLRSFVAAADDAVNRAVDITDRLLMMTEPSRDPAATLRLDELAGSALAGLGKLLSSEGVMLVEHLGQTPPAVGEESRLRFVVSSLLTNALDSLLDRPVRVLTVRTGRKDDQAFLEVEDTGCGIPSADLPRIFTPFFSTKGEWAPHGSPQARLKGLGLSLSLSSSTISDLGGRIEVHSTEGAGSVFRILLPTAETAPGVR